MNAPNINSIIYWRKSEYKEGEEVEPKEEENLKAGPAIDVVNSKQANFLNALSP